METLVEGMWQQILLHMYFSLLLLGTRISFLFLKVKSRKISPIPLASVDIEAPSRHGGVPKSYPASIRDLIFSMKPKRGRMVRKEAAVLGGLIGNPGDTHFFNLTH